MLARLLARVTRGLWILVAQSLVVAEVGRLILEAGTLGAVGIRRANSRLLENRFFNICNQGFCVRNQKRETTKEK